MQLSLVLHWDSMGNHGFLSFPGDFPAALQNPPETHSFTVVQVRSRGTQNIRRSRMKSDDSFTFLQARSHGMRSIRKKSMKSDDRFTFLQARSREMQNIQQNRMKNDDCFTLLQVSLMRNAEHSSKSHEK